jgi:hypothetical protein
MGNGLLIGGLLGGITGILIGIMLGFGIYAGIYYMQTGGTNIPYNSEHSKIAEGIKVTDLATGVSMTVKHLLTTESQFYPYAPMSGFTPRKTYTQSLWMWCSGDDVDMVMNIWGPSDDGHSYEVGFGRFMGNPFKIEGFGQTLTVDNFTAGCQSFWVTL